MKSKLTNKQQIILDEFIQLFLPKTGTEHKYPGNELEYIHSTLNQVFIQHFGFNLTTKDVLNAFKKLGYNTFIMKGTWDAENKIMKPSKTGKTNLRGTAKRTGISNLIENFVYIEVKVATVRILRKATAALPTHTNLDKYAKTMFMLEDIKSFKKKHFSPQPYM